MRFTNCISVSHALAGLLTPVQAHRPHAQGAATGIVARLHRIAFPPNRFPVLLPGALGGSEIWASSQRVAWRPRRSACKRLQTGLNARCCVPAAAATLSMCGSYHSTSAAVMNSFAASMALRRTRTASPTCSDSVGPKTEKHNASHATHTLPVTRHSHTSCQPCGPVQRARARRPRLHAKRVTLRGRAERESGTE